MASLYELDRDLEQVISGGFILDVETGEILFDSSNLDALQAEYNDKLEACACYIKGLEADARAIRAEEKALAARRQMKEQKAARLREMVAGSMQGHDMKKFETARVALSFRRARNVIITDPEALPEGTYNDVTERKPDKTKISKMIRSGADVPGATLREYMSLQVK